ncbi:MAG: methionyl-tRNA formyltransferase [Bacilli bacterium]|nr:methionyl-tRNA formyltransferase [Bacilli bacterium]
MRIVFMGTPVFAVNVLQGLIDHYEEEIVGVVSQPDKLVGRHHVLTPTPVKQLAIKYGIPVLQPEKIRKEYQAVLDLKPDIIITCAYGQIIPTEILEAPRLGCINVHASLLPKLRGGAPIHKAIIEDYKVTGVTIMYMDATMDTGDMISKVEVPILESDDLESLHDKLSDAGTQLLLETLPSIMDGTNSREKQKEEEATFAYNIKREEEHIDFSKSSREIFNLIRGLCPIPSANVLFDGCEMKVYHSIISSQKYIGKCGEIVDVTKQGIVVKTGDGAIVLTEIKPFGKKRMDASSYVNGVGAKNLIGKVFQ